MIALCALHAWMAASVSRVFSCTADEVAHLTSGYAFWSFDDYRLQPENGVLPQRWAALPLLGMNPRFPERSGEAWSIANVWNLGNSFLYKQGNDPDSMLAAGRTMISLLSALACLLVYVWTRELFGGRAAMLSLVLAVFGPEMLAHGGLATSDTAAALGFALAVMSWWRVLRRATPGRLLVAGLCAGFLAVSKHSVVLFAPMAVLMIAVRLARRAPLSFSCGSSHSRLSGWLRAPAAFAMLVASAAICCAVIWACYGFRYRAAPPEYADRVDFALTWETVLLENIPPDQPGFSPDGETVDHKPGVVQHFVRFSRDHRLLPEAWLYGLAFVEKNARSRRAFFCGEYRRTGWPAFFPVAFALKTTLPALILVSAGTLAILTARRRRRAALLYRVSPLLILLAVYWAFSLQSKLNIGHRHLLPTYPACYILAGACTGLAIGRFRRPAGIALAGLLGWHVAASIAARPDYLAYFNPLAGDPATAHRLFVDSSLDWGQDLPRLHEWLDAHASDKKVFLSYFGSGSPVYHGIRATRVGDGYFDWEPRRTPPALSGGIYCISATMFRRVYTRVRGPWSTEYENRYQFLKNWIDRAGRRPAGTPVTDIDGTPLDTVDLNDRLTDYEHLQFGRLCHVLQFRKPDAMVGRSFMIYHLDDADVTFALQAPLSVLNRRLLELYAGPTRQTPP